MRSAVGGRVAAMSDGVFCVHRFNPQMLPTAFGLHAAPCAVAGCARGFDGPDYYTVRSVPGATMFKLDASAFVSPPPVEKDHWVRAMFEVGQPPARTEWRWITAEEDERHRAAHAAAKTPEANGRFWRAVAEIQRADDDDDAR